MTHEVTPEQQHNQLIAIIRHYGKLEGQMSTILENVVNLHKPGRTTIGTNETVCNGCDQGDNYHSNMWPCDTIKMITEGF